ncbi:hypothetical protein DIPPA_09717 [Diplonema papillatum]|nr:hypothetical protein DIPPA_09717 [Diplonema papillatum]|eukprot:gene20742-31959_t
MQRAIKEWLLEFEDLPTFAPGSSSLGRCGRKAGQLKAAEILDRVVRDIEGHGQRFFIDLTNSCGSYAEVQRTLTRAWSLPVTRSARGPKAIEQANGAWKAKYDTDSCDSTDSGQSARTRTKRVRVIDSGIQARAFNVRLVPSLNDRVGTVVAVDHSCNRVKIEFPAPYGVVSLRPANVEPVEA